MKPKKNIRKILALAGAIGFGIAVLCVLIGAVIGPGDTDKPKMQSNTAATTKPAKPGNGKSSDPAESPQHAKKPGAVDSKPVIFDDTGMVGMEVTTDPRKAAASAASVLMSVDTSKAKWGEDFRNEALQRVMVPSVDYVGPGDQIIVTNGKGDSFNGDELVKHLPTLLQSMSYTPGGWWWMLGDNASFQGFVSYGAKIESKAVQVLDQQEMQEMSDGASWVEPSSAFMIDLKPGATFGLYWVRVETTTSTAEDATTARNPSALAIYCSAPEDGGLCGVVGLMTAYPSGWKTDF